MISTITPATTLQSRDVAQQVSDYFDVPLATLLARGRTRKLTQVRQIAMALAYRMTGESLHEVGNYFQRDHSTVLCAIRSVENLAATDHKWKQLIEAIAAQLKTRQERIVR